MCNVQTISAAEDNICSEKKGFYFIFLDTQIPINHTCVFLSEVCIFAGAEHVWAYTT
jgi:hypothetical protein